MAGARSPSRRITDAVTAWPGVEAGPGRHGELCFRIGRREFGHLHGDRVAHLGFPRELGALLREQGHVGPHPVRPDHPSWAARRIETEADVRAVIGLLRLNYDRVVARFGLPDQAGDAPR
jgi:hypothetical protein